MAKKIEVSTMRMEADVQVINVSSRLIYLALKAQMTLERLIDEATHETTKWNDVEKKWETQVDENGEPIFKIDSISGKAVSEHVMPFLNELVDALKEE
jgi:predicted Holliday junction resolvase-like endonuclease